MRFSLLPALLAIPLAAHGTVVNTVSDEDDGSLAGGTGISLREAVNYSAAGATITFAPTLAGQTIRLTGGQLVITKSLTIDGSTLPIRVTLSGDKTGDGKTPDDSRVIRINSGTVTLDSLIITGGYMSGTATGLQGGGIYVNSLGNCHLRRSILSGNSSQYEGGGVFNLGILTILQCEISGNSGVRAGAIFNLSSFASVVIENSTISGNFSSGYAGGIWNWLGTVTLKNSTLTHNSANFDGGGIDNNGTFIIENTTIQGNAAKLSGGGIRNTGTLNLKNSTISQNISGTAGGGIYRGSGDFVLNNSIVAGNFAPATPEIFGNFTGSNNLTAAAPLLAPLGDYGGPTPTMPPLPGSPAIDAGGTTPLTADQRGFPRVSLPDIGAAESQGTPDLVRFWTLDFDGDGSPYGVEQALGTDPLLSDAQTPRNLSGPRFNSFGHARLQIGQNSEAAPETQWILSRSFDLSPGNFVEVFRFGGRGGVAAPGFSFTHAPGRSFSVTDENPPPGGAFYRFEAVLDP